MLGTVLLTFVSLTPKVRVPILSIASAVVDVILPPVIVAIP